MTQVVIEEKITMANHIKGTFPKNVGKAHPTKTPLNPQSPAVLSLRDTSGDIR